MKVLAHMRSKLQYLNPFLKLFTPLHVYTLLACSLGDVVKNLSLLFPPFLGSLENELMLIDCVTV